MEDEIYELSKYRIEKARKDLDSSKINFENKLYSQSINRSYYCIFHAARALLAFDRFDSKKHSGIISYFNLHYIKQNKIEKKYSEIITTAERIRINTDYRDFYVVSMEEAKKQIKDAENFLNRIETYIKINYPKA
jgi:uncharacterized protein (UPF0332 family)